MPTLKGRDRASWQKEQQYPQAKFGELYARTVGGRRMGWGGRQLPTLMSPAFVEKAGWFAEGQEQLKLVEMRAHG